jgi:hypothetical protein
MFMLILTELKGRPTMDIDLLAIQMSNDLVEIENIFREIAAAKYNDDIYSLLNMNDFTGKLLYMAIRETFSRRQTKMDVDTIIFTQSFRQNSDRNTMWKAFLKKINMESISFEEVMLEITTFTKPVYDSILNNTELLLDWNHNEKEWHVSS